jgi:cytochrome c-type biogenesis protein CcmH
MLVVALAFVLLPLLRPSRPTHNSVSRSVSHDVSNVNIFRAQKNEIESDFAQSLITADERDQALNELTMRVASEVKADTVSVSTDASNASRGAWLVAIFAAVGFPLAAVLVYATLGTPQAVTGAVATAAAPAKAQPNGEGAEPPMSDKQILAMVDSLAQKMEKNPSDAKGWILLARSQNALGRFVEADKSYARAIALQPNDAQLLADYADAAVMAQEGKFDGKPYELIKQALKFDPNNMKALALAGTAEMRMGNKDQSLKHWEKIKSLVAKDSEDYREVESIIAEVKGGPPVVRSPPAAPAAPVKAPASAGNERITGDVTITPELIAKVSPQDTLYVFARAVNGPPMPLAVMRVSAPKTWPVKFELTDAMAMAPGVKLSAFSEVTVEARISKSGNAKAQTGDLTGQSAALKPGASKVAITISRVVP